MSGPWNWLRLHSLQPITRLGLGLLLSTGCNGAFSFNASGFSTLTRGSGSAPASTGDETAAPTTTPAAQPNPETSQSSAGSAQQGNTPAAAASSSSSPPVALAPVAKTSPQIGTLKRGKKSRWDMRYSSYSGGSSGGNLTLYCSPTDDQDKTIVVSGGVVSFDIWLVEPEVFADKNRWWSQRLTGQFLQLLTAAPATVHLNVQIKADGTFDQIIPLSPESINYLKLRAAVAVRENLSNDYGRGMYVESASMTAVHVWGEFLDIKPERKGDIEGHQGHIQVAFSGEGNDQPTCTRGIHGEDYSYDPSNFCSTKGSGCDRDSSCCSKSCGPPRGTYGKRSCQ